MIGGVTHRMLPHLFVSPTSMQQALPSFKMVISFACLLSVRPLLSSMAVMYHENRELKQRRPRRQRERHKGNRLSLAKSNSARASRFFVNFFAVNARLRRENA